MTISNKPNLARTSRPRKLRDREQYLTAVKLVEEINYFSCFSGTLIIDEIKGNV